LVVNSLSRGLPELLVLLSLSPKTPISAYFFLHLAADCSILLSPIISMSKPFSSNIFLGKIPFEFSTINLFLNSSE